MELQLVEVYIPEEALEDLQEKLEGFPIISHWHFKESEQYELVRILVKKTSSEEILNFLEQNAKYNDKLKALLFTVQTYIPRIIEEEEEKKEQNTKAEMIRASRHELYTVVHSSSEITRSFTWFLFLSAIVAAAGIIKNSPAIVIGAMVIAPLMGPYTSAAFASVLGDYKLMRQSAITSLYGLSVPLVISALFGFFFQLPINSNEFLARTNIEFIDIAVALASGAAGALSFVKRMSEALVGVMVSVALLPPTVVFGMMLGSGEWSAALTPLLLLLVNISSILLSAILVFWLSGIKPVNWKEIQVANTSRKFALLFVSFIILILFVVIYFISF
ncbi:TIGR00341 family protein [Aquibacillus halophilus]|uniref:TIGR00341 family protein n=1 Tax=Aquibacillus halophilus TaxID=930132 RepID=A0A6A8DV57_9BACI|nr:TIGR00341 family protein [Aquibacillus halophilus]MRH45092.1 TIGR00341 family protein [Aquibacillus halophilus]